MFKLNLHANYKGAHSCDNLLLTLLINNMACGCYLEAGRTFLLEKWRRQCGGKLVVINKRVHWCKAGITQRLFIAFINDRRSTANTLCVRRRSWNQKQEMLHLAKSTRSHRVLEPFFSPLHLVCWFDDHKKLFRNDILKKPAFLYFLLHYARYN